MPVACLAPRSPATVMREAPLVSSSHPVSADPPSKRYLRCPGVLFFTSEVRSQCAGGGGDTPGSGRGCRWYGGERWLGGRVRERYRALSCERERSAGSTRVGVSSRVPGGGRGGGELSPPSRPV